MTKLLLDKNEKDKLYNLYLSEREMWRKIEDLNWYDISKNAKDPNEEICKTLLKTYPKISDIEMLYNFVLEKRKKLLNYLNGYLKASPQHFKRSIILSDDGMWDFASHIIGLGEVMFKYVYDNPNVIIVMQEHKKENFEYGFNKAIHILSTNELIS